MTHVNLDGGHVRNGRGLKFSDSVHPHKLFKITAIGHSCRHIIPCIHQANPCRLPFGTPILQEHRKRKLHTGAHLIANFFQQLDFLIISKHSNIIQ